MEWSLHLNELNFTVRESSRRKTVSLGLERDGQLLVLAPQGTPARQLEQFIESRMDWIYGKLALKTELYRSPQQREYVTGEGFLYAGRSYRLLLVPTSQGRPPLRLHGQRFELAHTDAAQGRELFVAWYSAQLNDWVQAQLARLQSRLRCPPKEIRVTDLGYRWGAASRTGSITLHWRVALLPHRVAEYVLLHELVHLEFHHHRPAFWERLEVMLPDYADRKAWLAQHGADYDL
ncbi:M48 family metallopeptidase [Deinococcus radiophilus]|uniref:M48 family peptidase n=1 Tax=Deinococcus radiophilus TaxID=32062 RepID=A0A431VMH6_9DEIO|nr:SprT family zinc-dependent metalloprotease [Deinococcus radiophilus]RTR23437.1 M48 family peptidase [Deinococcus radiophilus]UFA50345.1 M48 family metallopeptidase [Deinococcus radiophilus]